MTAPALAPSWLAVPDDANALPAFVWPANARRTEDGELELAGVRVGDLAERFGTPVYVMDEADVRARAVAVREAFEDAFAPLGLLPRVYYASKAFLSGAIVRWVTEEGLGIDVASGGELAVALAAGADPARIGFHGNNKSSVEIERAVAAGVGTIILDSPAEVERVASAARAAGAVQSVRLRVNSGVHAHTHAFLATAHEDQKFGVSLEDTPGLVARIRELPELSFLGLHCHIGSQIFGAEGFEESASRLLAVHARLLKDGPVPSLNLGGGYGIAYTSADDPDDIRAIAQRIADVVGARCEALGIPVPDVAFEPGRIVVGPSTVTLYRVGTIKPVTVDAADGPATRTYVSVDGGMSDNARPALYGADYSARIASRTSKADPALVRVVGKHCESGDIVVDAEYLPGDVRADDLLAVPATGAYCWSLASNYNYLGRPPVVAVRDGQARVIVRGETESDLLARDVELAERKARA